MKQFFFLSYIIIISNLHVYGSYYYNNKYRMVGIVALKVIIYFLLKINRLQIKKQRLE
jgi:hypothetical protein